ncbi:uncharacterized protein MYCFIDRAFT_175308 [Pseudocercospora fijiensis CIRAD86]|uniref:Uncharacterized protein n=1 Tax=Pseudocercospora fijiensis (strain CIRAD86) TaxID=383855 RepID=M2ZRQ8_PSEFD|nr:uncharacterized protein MYCFIDRAFT_175308 [Pseudocercospora fijiensis CIRAD86]EME81719.1 hypothetical protein MYCFIDRAFT_175308 [Pseudocercospora fijiensis CIRAD86]
MCVTESRMVRGEMSSTLGLLLPLKPYAKYLPDPFFSKGLQSMRPKMQEPMPSHNMAFWICWLMPRTEMAIRCSDTVSNPACAIFYWVQHGERAAPGTMLRLLQAELDAAIPADADLATDAQAMRLHSTSAIGLPRLVTSEGGVQNNGELFPRSSVLSVPSHTIHHDAETRSLTARQRICFNPFSFGPRASVGQNVAHMELALIVGTAFHRFEFELYQEVLESHEGFSKSLMNAVWAFEDGERRLKYSIHCLSYSRLTNPAGTLSPSLLPLSNTTQNNSLQLAENSIFSKRLELESRSLITTFPTALYRKKFSRRKGNSINITQETTNAFSRESSSERKQSQLYIDSLQAQHQSPRTTKTHDPC